MEAHVWCFCFFLNFKTCLQQCMDVLLLMSYYDQKWKMEKKVKKHYDHIRTASIKKLNWLGQNLSEKPNRSIPVPISNGGERRCRNEIRSMTSLILFFSFSVRIPPMVVTIRTPRVHSKALRRSPADSHWDRYVNGWSTNHISLGEVLWNLETRWLMHKTRVASSTMHIRFQDCG